MWGSSVRSRALVVICAIFTTATVCPRAALAYPTSIVFAPTGEVKELGTFAHVGFGAMILSPKVQPGTTWFANEVGLLPKIPYGSSGTGFGGLEAGIDAYNSDNFGLPNAYVKPLVNAKVQVLTEYKWVPAIGGGFIAAPFQGSRSQNVIFGAVTRRRCA